MTVLILMRLNSQKQRERDLAGEKEVGTDWLEGAITSEKTVLIINKL